MSYTTTFYAHLQPPTSVPLTVDSINDLTLSRFAAIQAVRFKYHFALQILPCSCTQLDDRRIVQENEDARRLEGTQEEVEVLRKRLEDQKKIVKPRPRKGRVEVKEGEGAVTQLQPLPPLPPLPGPSSSTVKV
jgi:hypothetical protein